MSLDINFRTLYNEGNQNLEDPSITPLKWQNELFEPGRKLTIGYYDSDGSFEPHPGCKRAVQEAVAILKKQGHTLIKVGLVFLKNIRVLLENNRTSISILELIITTKIS